MSFSINELGRKNGENNGYPNSANDMKPGTLGMKLDHTNPGRRQVLDYRIAPPDHFVGTRFIFECG